jgi:hypothetical protein
MPVSRHGQHRSLEGEFLQEPAEQDKAVRPGGDEAVKGTVGDFREKLA